MSDFAHTIAVDVMGSDLGPAEVILGAMKALSDRDDFRIVFVGDRGIIQENLTKYGPWPTARVEIFHASEVIGMDEKPIHSIRSKKDASIVKAIELVYDGKVHAMLSCGNTGSLMAGSTLKLRPMEGVERPALATVIPTMRDYIVMADVGANPNTTPLQMVHNAILSSNYCSRILGIERPSIGLLTIGTEEGKGNDVTLEAHKLLKKIGNLIHYEGLIEGFQIFKGTVNVVLCDGFVGNILLKTLESLVIQLKGYIKNEFKKNPLRMLGAVLARGAFDSLRGRLNPETYGAASLLGLNGIVLKSHGSSTHRAIRSAVRMAAAAARQEATQICQGKINLANQILQSA